MKNTAMLLGRSSGKLAPTPCSPGAKEETPLRVGSVCHPGPVFWTCRVARASR